eukprot:XP_027306029.1 junctophilin-1 [Anas platyrhynchos]
MTGGRFDFDDGGTYCGGWEDGKAHGHGICTGPKGQGEYAGSWSHGFEVAGGYTWPSGNTYLGYWAQGKRHGLGVETKGRWMYRGEWSHGFKGRYGVRQSLSTFSTLTSSAAVGIQDTENEKETKKVVGTYQGQWTGGMRHGYGVRQSVPYGMATVIRSPLRTSLASLRSEQSNGTVLHDITADSPAGTRGGFVLNFHSDVEAMGIKKKGGLFRRGSLLGSIKLRKSESRSSISSKRSSVRSDAAMSRISSSDANSTISFGDGDCDYCPMEDHVDATTTETYMGEWKNDKRSALKGTYQGQWTGGMRHGYGVRQSVPYGMATVIRSPLRTSLASLRSEQSNGTVLHDITADSPAGTRGGFVLNFHSDVEAMGIKKKGGLFRRGSLLGSIKLRKSESRSSISSKRSSVRSDAAMSRISSSDANSTISFGDGDCDYCPMEDHVDATTTETYMGEWKNDKRSGFGVSERSNGMKYEGEWLNNRRHGYGCTMFPDGTKEEGKYKNNVLVRGIRKQLIPIRNTKTREKVDRAIEGAQRAAAMARTKVEIATSRTAHARAKADAADQAAQSARQECDIARAVARELSPNFYQPGPDYIKQKFQEGMEVKEKTEEKVQEKPTTPKESPHFYRKGTTPPRTPEASPRHSPPLPSEPSPSKHLKRQSSTSGARLNQEKKLLATENITATVNKPLYSKAPVKEDVAVKHQSKFSAHHNPISTENGELHGHYHGYYVKMNPTVLPQELREEDDEYVNPLPSTLARIPPSQKPSPARSGGKPDAKENKPDTKVKKPEIAAPKNPANNESSSAVEKEVANSSGPNSVMIALVMLLNIGLAILFVHFLT